MERTESASLKTGAGWSRARKINRRPATPAIDRCLPPTPTEVFRDLGMSWSAIAAYFHRFPDRRPAALATTPGGACS